MFRKALIFLVALVHVVGLAGCDNGRSPSASSPVSPTAPSAPVPEPTVVQLAGTVSDGAWRPFFGATVEVVNGPHAGLKTLTDSRGEFRLTGSFDETTEFRATKDGYVAAVQALPARCEPCNPRWWIHFMLESGGPKPDLAGNYSLTLVADSCPGLPDEMRTRSYDAVATLISNPTGPANTHFLVTVSGAPFQAGYNQFMLGVTGDYLSGFLGDLHGDPGILERIAETTYLGFEGVPGGAIAPDVSTIVAAFTGAIDYCERKVAMGSSYSCNASEAVVHVRCESKNHQLVLTRR